MKVDELRASVEECRSSLRDKSGKWVIFGETGPVGMGVVDALVEFAEALDRRVSELEKQMNGK